MIYFTSPPLTCEYNAILYQKQVNKSYTEEVPEHLCNFLVITRVLSFASHLGITLVLGI